MLIYLLFTNLPFNQEMLIYLLFTNLPFNQEKVN